VPHSIQAELPGDLNVATAVICNNVTDRRPIETGNEFPVSVGRLYCYNKITDIRNSTKITHVWYFKDTERARVTLGVNPPDWRTYSSKIIQAHEVGDWHVEILNASGNSLGKVKFKITN
jgi:hypothetical protein